MKTSLPLLFMSFILMTACTETESDKTWKMGTQAYTFRAFSFFEAVDKTHELGLHFIEAYPGQEIGGGLEGKMGHDLNAETRKAIKDHLQNKQVEWKAFGVVVAKDKEDWRKLYEFAKDMGISTIVSEPNREDLPFLATLSDKYKIDLAIHNHPQPSPYWHPDTLMNAIEGLSDRVGACADFGHYVRSGLDLAESLKKLEGRIIEAHIKDIADHHKEAEDVVWGTGVVPLEEALDLLEKTGFSGLLSVEYEADPEDNMKQLEESLNYFKRIQK